MLGQQLPHIGRSTSVQKLLALESSDLSQAEKEIFVCYAEQIHIKTTLKTALGCHFE